VRTGGDPEDLGEVVQGAAAEVALEVAPRVVAEDPAGAHGPQRVPV